MSQASHDSAGVPCERAIFTSLPSATGEGYRLTAVSPGLKADERIEVTRRSPSHDSLCSRAPTAAGIAVYPLESGRISVSLARYVGAEHTRRGGGRVWTDILVCEPGGYTRLGAHPDSFCRAIASLARTKPVGAVLSPVAVESWTDASASASKLWDGATLAGLASILHSRTAAVAAAGKASAYALVWALYMLPAFARRELSCSGGLRFSRMRQIQCCIIDDMDQDAMRATRGHGITCFNAAEVRRTVSDPLRPWLTLATRWWDQGRAGDIARVSSALRGSGSFGYMGEIVSVCEAIDRQEKEPAELDWLLERAAA